MEEDGKSIRRLRLGRARGACCARFILSPPFPAAPDRAMVVCWCVARGEDEEMNTVGERMNAPEGSAREGTVGALWDSCNDWSLFAPTPGMKPTRTCDARDCKRVSARQRCDRDLQRMSGNGTGAVPPPHLPSQRSRTRPARRRPRASRCTDPKRAASRPDCATWTLVWKWEQNAGGCSVCANLYLSRAAGGRSREKGARVRALWRDAEWKRSARTRG